MKAPRLQTTLAEGNLPAATVCIGVFDGVHLGHQELIKTTIQQAGRDGSRPTLGTFDRNPLELLAPLRAPCRVASLAQNQEQFFRLGITTTAVYEFDLEFASQEAQVFLERELIGRLNAKRLVVGHDFAFGRDRKGTTAWLSERIETVVVPPLEIAGTRVSSTQVRRAVSAGEITAANKLLGRPFELEGVVTKGQQLGREFGFPTLNLVCPAIQCVPANGVYAGAVRIGDDLLPSAIGIGTRPTVDDGPRSIEAHVVGTTLPELYGSPVRFGFLTKLRDEERFTSIDDLRAAMARDCEAAMRAYLKEPAYSRPC